MLVVTIGTLDVNRAGTLDTGRLDVTGTFDTGRLDVTGTLDTGRLDVTGTFDTDVTGTDTGASSHHIYIIIILVFHYTRSLW